MRDIIILGSTGSIGTQTIETIEKYGSFKVKGLAAYSNIKMLEEQARRFLPEVVCVYDDKAARELATALSDTCVKVLSGMEGLCELAAMGGKGALVVTAVVGMIGINPTIAAIKSGSDIALANKETLVCAGHIIMKLIKEYGVNLYPIDSEHSAIFQCLNGENKGQIDKILLTASGGPFRHKTKEELEHVKLADALAHPNWSMGKKITVDSSTMVNKALEVMEAKWLFGVDVEDIEVVIQPESIIHSAVAFKDGSVMAQMAYPDMRIPIRYALYYPQRLGVDEKRLNLFEIGQIHFEKPDTSVLKGLSLGRRAALDGPGLCTVFNAANEAAVNLFLNEKISFLTIYDIIEKCMEGYTHIDSPSVEEILELQRFAELSAGQFCCR